MTFNTYGNIDHPGLLLIPGLGVSHEIFLSLIDLLQDKFFIIAAGINGFLIGQKSQFTSVDDIVYKHPEIFCFNEGRVRLPM